MLDGPIPEIRFEAAASDEEVAAVRSRVAALREGCRRLPAPRPCCVITPLGLERRDEIARLLAGQRLGVWGSTSIVDWAVATAHLRCCARS